MIPKTEKELEIYFALLKLAEAKKRADEPPTYPPYIAKLSKEEYERQKAAYFKLIKQ